MLKKVLINIEDILFRCIFMNNLSDINIMKERKIDV